MAWGGVGLFAVRIDEDDVGMVGFREQVAEVPVQKALSRPPTTVIVLPTNVLSIPFGRNVLVAEEALTTLSLSHVHVADDTPTKSKRDLHGQKVVDTLSLSV